MKVSDVIVKILEAWSLEDVFLVTGGGSMHLNDSFGRSKKIHCIPLHHEQACSMAADAYFRIKNKPAVVNVTTGPGGINALNGVYGAYVDSIPMIIISGQVRSDHLVKNIDPLLRQFGDQEAKITQIAKSITKKTLLLESTKNLVNKINEMVYNSNIGRKGPVWIDVPLDIQAANIAVKKSDIQTISKKWIDKLRKDSFFAPKKELKKIKSLVNLIKKSKRPIIVAGNGIRFSENFKKFNKFINLLKIPVTTVWNSHDLLTNDNAYYAGRPGADGERAGNFNIQNSDLILVMGARMHVRQIGFNHESFARNAKKVMIDIDKSELDKFNLNIDLKINMNLNVFFTHFFEIAKEVKLDPSKYQDYLKYCKKNVKELNVLQNHHTKPISGSMNPYHFVDILFRHLNKDTDIITGDGTAAVVTFKVANLKEGQRLFTNKGCASMGYDVPAIIGALYADRNLKKRDKVLITGDGSIMMNIQDLISLRKFKHSELKIFVLNNEGYHSIRQSQQNYFDGYEVGCGENSGLFFPSFKKIASCFEFAYLKVTNETSLKNALKDKQKGIKLIEVVLDKNQTFEPRVSATKLNSGKMVSSPLEEMSPLLPKKEFLNRMLIEINDDSNYKE